MDLMGRGVDEVKKEIARITKHKPEEVYLFGSRINGNNRDDSDLDIAIQDKKIVPMFYIDVFGMRGEVRYVKNVSNLVLKYGVII
jgi:predicted nucleotidyltransferase